MYIRVATRGAAYAFWWLHTEARVMTVTSNLRITHGWRRIQRICVGAATQVVASRVFVRSTVSQPKIQVMST